VKDGWSEGRLERSGSKSSVPPTHITNNLPLVASLIIEQRGEPEHRANGNEHGERDEDGR